MEENQENKIHDSLPETQELIFEVMPDYKIVVPKTAPKDTGVASSANQSIQIPNRNSGSRRLWLFVIILIAVLLGVVSFIVYKVNFATREGSVAGAQDQADSSLVVQTNPLQTEGNPFGQQLTSEFLAKYFNVEQCEKPILCAFDADPDKDGLVNYREQELLTDPNNQDSDGDGISDGDEATLFKSNPLKVRTSDDEKYTDTDNIKNGYSPSERGRKLTDQEITTIAGLVKQYGVHMPTLETLGDSGAKLYKFSLDLTATATPSVGTTSPAESFGPLPITVDTSPEETLARDTQRLNTVKKIGVALVKYKNTSKEYPGTLDFNEMFTKIKPFLGVATNATDPINKGQYTYTYLSNTQQTFQITYFSETQKQVIKYTEQNAEKDFISEQKLNVDDQRKRDMESIKSALMLYSRTNLPTNGKVENVFPPTQSLSTELVPKYLSSLPKDPKTGKAYDYKVAPSFDSFTLKTVLDDAPDGYTGYRCNQDEECDYY